VVLKLESFYFSNISNIDITYVIANTAEFLIAKKAFLRVIV